MTYQNHLIDPTYFYDAIEEFSFNYDIYIVVSITQDERGLEKYTYQKQTIRGSLQSSGLTEEKKKEGTIDSKSYKFYCKSLYRINVGDIIEYKNNYYRCDSVQDYDEFGVRECSLSMIQLTAYRDLLAYIKYLNGTELV